MTLCQIILIGTFLQRSIKYFMYTQRPCLTSKVKSMVFFLCPHEAPKVTCYGGYANYLSDGQEEKWPPLIER